MRITEVVKTISGTPQFRINESLRVQAPLYSIYSQNDLQQDLFGVSSDVPNKTIRTWDKVSTLDEQDILFSLISGDASVVRKSHEGYLFTQNYVKLIPCKKVDSRYLVYLINQNESIKRQFRQGLQGSQVLKYTLKQLRELVLPDFPTLEKQRMIGEVYFKQLRLEAIKKQAAELETTLLFQKLKEVT